MNEKLRLELYEIQTNILKIILKHLTKAKREFIFVGGTARNRLLFSKPYRFSKDLDLFIEEISNMHYLDELYGGENLSSLIKELKNQGTNLITKGHPVLLNFLENKNIRKIIEDDFFIEYNVEVNFKDEIIELNDTFLKIPIKTLTPLEFLNNKLIKLRDRIEEDNFIELVKDMIDIFMIYKIFNCSDNNSIKLKNEIILSKNLLREHWEKSFELESKKYLFDLNVIPKDFDTFYNLLLRIK